MPASSLPDHPPLSLLPTGLRLSLSRPLPPLPIVRAFVHASVRSCAHVREMRVCVRTNTRVSLSLCPLPLSLITPSFSFPPVSVSLSLGLFLLYLTPSHPPAACCARASHRQGPQASDRVLLQGVFLPLSAHFVRARSCMRVPNNMIIIHAQCACVRARECAFVRAREYLSLAES